MNHTIIYHGRYTLNFERLRAYEGHLQDFTRLTERTLDSPSSKVDGIAFGYMQDGDRFLAVRVNDVVLAKPIELDPRIHTDGKGFGPTPSQFGDKSAKKLLKDIIEANPKQEAELIQLYDVFFGSK